MTSVESAPPRTSPFREAATLELSVVVLSWNTAELLRACLASLRRHPFPGSWEVIVVDNGSADESAALVASEFPAARLIRNAVNEGYARGNNIGLREARGELLLLLNSDTEVHPGTLERLAGFLREHPDAGAVSCQFVGPDGAVQPSCMRFPSVKTVLVYDTILGALFPRGEMTRYYYRDFDHRTTREVEQPPGACFMVRRAALERVGLLDEGMFLFFNDVDLCLRLRQAGWRIWFLADARILHHVGGSTRRFTDTTLEWHKNRTLYYRKHHGRLATFLCKGAALYVAARVFVQFLLGRGPKRNFGEFTRYLVRGVGTVWRI